MVIDRINGLFRRSSTQRENEKNEEKVKAESLQETWEEYISTKPTTDDLSLLFIRYGENSIHESKEIKELVWKELKSRTDLRSEDLLRAVLYCGEPGWIPQEAWYMLPEEDLEKNLLERIVEQLGSSHPISQEIEERFGKTGKAVLEKMDAIVR